MHGIAVAVLSEDREHTVVLQSRLESTNLARVVYSHAGFPAGPTDPVLRQVQDQRAEIVLVDIDPQSPQRAISTIELIHSTTNDTGDFAIGKMAQPATIVAAMRAGAGNILIDPRGAKRCWKRSHALLRPEAVTGMWPGVLASSPY
jgi:hypothetical protein